MFPASSFSSDAATLCENLLAVVGQLPADSILVDPLADYYTSESGSSSHKKRGTPAKERSGRSGGGYTGSLLTISTTENGSNSMIGGGGPTSPTTPQTPDAFNVVDTSTSSAQANLFNSSGNSNNGALSSATVSYAFSPSRSNLGGGGNSSSSSTNGPAVVGPTTTNNQQQQQSQQQQQLPPHTGIVDLQQRRRMMMGGGNGYGNGPAPQHHVHFSLQDELHHAEHQGDAHFSLGSPALMGQSATAPPPSSSPPSSSFIQPSASLHQRHQPQSHVHFQELQPPSPAFESIPLPPPAAAVPPVSSSSPRQQQYYQKLNNSSPQAQPTSAPHNGSGGGGQSPVFYQLPSAVHLGTSVGTHRARTPSPPPPSMAHVSPQQHHRSATAATHHYRGNNNYNNNNNTYLPSSGIFPPSSSSGLSPSQLSASLLQPAMMMSSTATAERGSTTRSRSTTQSPTGIRNDICSSYHDNNPNHYNRDHSSKCSGHWRSRSPPLAESRDRLVDTLQETIERLGTIIDQQEVSLSQAQQQACEWGLERLEFEKALAAAVAQGDHDAAMIIQEGKQEIFKLAEDKKELIDIIAQRDLEIQARDDATNKLKISMSALQEQSDLYEKQVRQQQGEVQMVNWQKEEVAKQAGFGRLLADQREGMIRAEYSDMDKEIVQTRQDAHGLRKQHTRLVAQLADQQQETRRWQTEAEATKETVKLCEARLKAVNNFVHESLTPFVHHAVPFSAGGGSPGRGGDRSGGGGGMFSAVGPSQIYQDSPGHSP